MAMNPHLTLKIAGNAAKGDSTQLADGSVELYSVAFGVSQAMDTSTGAPAGRREYSSLVVSKRVDKLTPLLFQALTTNQTVEGTVKFWRAPVDGSAVDEQFFTLDFKVGRIESITVGGGTDHPSESLSFVFRAITITYDSKGAKGVTHSDDWSKAK